ncbi:uncharacterized protein FA14DRAFT_189337 [Meira miltonrushii]|uniref:Uncharacterized protein n=1 Tax=Meira miltonrushii TaxID=1280837 RepID=A0A316VCS9_9BASI|nr:uncharacterized protein FA14DRAFT_189337 [Meira miltonrushii]PWN35362.1 hypothetical protein FA14DRAFT_189337 [Meira miltonrushii]
MPPMKNPDGTVNFEGLKGHLNFVKGKYEQNAKNYKANTGKEMGFGAQDEGVQGSLGGQSAAPQPNATQNQQTDTREQDSDAPDATLHDERKND